MSVMNQSGEEKECPLCMEPLEVDDLHFYPCTCGYQICRFCWNRIREGENGLCPACRKAYPENPADFTPLSQEQVAAMKTEKRAREQQRRNKTLESRRQLSSVRVVQKNLVFVVGLPVRLADPEVLKKQEYFGKYGKIHKVVINHSTAYAGSQGPSASAYVTYVSSADALRAIQNVNNVTIDGRVLKGSLGTTKYCANFMRNQPCPKVDCMYLHELGDPKASFTKEEMHQGQHQIYERKLHNQLLAQQDVPIAPSLTTSLSKGSVSAKDSSPPNSSQNTFIPTTVVTSSNININNSMSKSGSNLSGMGGGTGVPLSSSSSSSSSTSSINSKEAWPSLNPSPSSHSPNLNESINLRDSQRQGSTPSPQTSVNHNQNSQNNSKSKQNKNKENQQANSDTSNKSNKSGQSTKEKKGSNSKKNKSDKQFQQHNQAHTGISENIKNNILDADNGNDNEINNFKGKTNDREKFDKYHEQAFSNSLIMTENDDLELDTDDRHSLLDNHDLLDNSEHSLLDDNEDHNLLSNITNNHLLIMNRLEQDMMGLGGPLMQGNIPLKPNLGPDYGMLENRNPFSGDHQIGHSMLTESNELRILRERQSEILRQNELARHKHGLLQSQLGKPYINMNSASGLENSEMIGNGNMYQSRNVLPPFGMRMDGTVATNYGLPIHNNQGMGNLSMLQGSNIDNHILTNGFSIDNSTSKGRYMGENSMDKFFTDFHKNLQLKSIINQRGSSGMPTQNDVGVLNHTQASQHQVSMQSLAYIESQQHIQRNFGNLQDNITMPNHFLNGLNEENMTDARQLGIRLQSSDTFLHQKSANDQQSGQDAQLNQIGDNSEQQSLGNDKQSIVDDDLDFDPIKETQKGLAEMMATEMLQQNEPKSSPESNERLSRRARPPGTGFTHMNAFGIGVPRPQPSQGYSQTGIVSDWTQIDPAIVSTSFNFPQKKVLLQQQQQQQQQQQLQQQQQQLAQQELFARFNRSLTINPTMVNGVNKIMPQNSQLSNTAQMQQMSLIQQGNNIHHQNGLVMPQQQQQQMSNNHLMGNQANQQQYLMQQRKMHSMMPPVNLNGWAMPSNNASMPAGQYSSSYYNNTNVMNSGSALEMNQNSKYNNLSLSSGFTNAPKNNTPVTTECIESK